MKKSVAAEETAGDAAAILPPPPSLADDLAAKALCEKFLDRIVADDIDAAFTALQPYFLISETEWLMIEKQTFQQLSMMRPRFGATLGFALVREDNIDDIVLRFTYVMKLERHAIVWTFYFYRPADAWLFNEFSIDPNFSELFN